MQCSSQSTECHKCPGLAHGHGRGCWSMSGCQPRAGKQFRVCTSVPCTSWGHPTSVTPPWAPIPAAGAVLNGVPEVFFCPFPGQCLATLHGAEVPGQWRGAVLGACWNLLWDRGAAFSTGRAGLGGALATSRQLCVHLEGNGAVGVKVNN